MISELSGDFFEKTVVGQDIPPLSKKAVVKELFMTWGRPQGELHPVFGDSHLENMDSQAVRQAEVKGMDTIHFMRILPGMHALEFLSQMITNWLPSARGWLFGGKLNAKMVRPITPDELITCQGRVTQKVEDESRRCLICEVWIEKETGEPAVVGEATIQF
ncbi:MaoC family dehydratase [Chloroflexota bacterium]